MGGVNELSVRVTDYINNKRGILDSFGIKEDYYIKPAINEKWEVTSPEEDFYVLCHGAREMQNSVIVKKDNKPLIISKGKHTMIVALDCVKVCFIFENRNYIGKIPEQWQNNNIL